MTEVLVIRLGALGDFVLSFAAFAAIRAHHPDARITLLTTAPYADLARRSPWFDTVRLDTKPPWWDLRGVARLRATLRGPGGPYDMVYDLQTSRRTSRYFALAGRPPWSGIAAGCSHPHANWKRDSMHTLERQRDQLRMAGIADLPRPSLAWLTTGPLPDLPPRPYAVLVPGAAAHRPGKRWPAERYGALATRLAARGIASVVLGSRDEARLAAVIQADAPDAVDLTGSTTIPDIAAIAARARVAVGNDTGPMHLAAAVGCHSVVLFSADSEPALTAPRGPDGGWATVLRSDDLADLPVERVAAALP